MKCKNNIVDFSKALLCIDKFHRGFPGRTRVSRNIRSNTVGLAVGPVQQGCPDPSEISGLIIEYNSMALLERISRSRPK